MVVAIVDCNMREDSVGRTGRCVFAVVPRAIIVGAVWARNPVIDGPAGRVLLELSAKRPRLDLMQSENLITWCLCI